jgi:excisionase family DNA binding protein
MEELLTIEEAATRLLLTPKYVQELIRQGKLGCVQLTPRKRAILAEQVDEYIQGHIPARPKMMVDKAKGAQTSCLPKRIPSQCKGGDTAAGDSARARLRKEVRSWR